MAQKAKGCQVSFVQMQLESAFQAQILSNIEVLFILQLFASALHCPNDSYLTAQKNQLFHAFSCCPVSRYFVLNYHTPSRFLTACFSSPWLPSWSEISSDVPGQPWAGCFMCVTSGIIPAPPGDWCCLDFGIENPRLGAVGLGRKPLVGAGASPRPPAPAGVVFSNLPKRKLWGWDQVSDSGAPGCQQWRWSNWRLSDKQSRALPAIPLGFFMPCCFRLLPVVMKKYWWG